MKQFATLLLAFSFIATPLVSNAYGEEPLEVYVASNDGLRVMEPNFQIAELELLLARLIAKTTGQPIELAALDSRMGVLLNQLAPIVLAFIDSEDTEYYTDAEEVGIYLNSARTSARQDNASQFESRLNLAHESYRDLREVTEAIIEDQGGDTPEPGNRIMLEVDESNDNPNASTLLVEEDSDSDAYAILGFELEAQEEDEGLDTMAVALHLGGAYDFDEVVSDAYVEIAGREHDLSDSESIGNSSVFSGGKVYRLFFDTIKTELPQGEGVEGSLVLQFQDRDGNYEQGTQVAAAIGPKEVASIVIDDEEIGDRGEGEAHGEIHTLMSEGIIGEIDSISSVTVDGDMVGRFKFEYDVTAFEGDFYLASPSFNVMNESGSTIRDADEIFVVTSTARRENGYFLVEEGESESFTLTIDIRVPTTRLVRVAMTDLWYGEKPSKAGTGNRYQLTPAGDWRSSTVQIVGSGSPNNAPDARNDSASTSAGQPVTISVLKNDTDEDNDRLELSWPDTFAPVKTKGGGIINHNNLQTITYTPAKGFSGSDSFTYTVSDGEATDKATVSVTVKGGDDKPTIESITAEESNEAEEVNVKGASVSNLQAQLQVLIEKLAELKSR